MIISKRRCRFPNRFGQVLRVNGRKELDLTYLYFCRIIDATQCNANDFIAEYATHFMDRYSIQKS